jgi:ABC-2 type transport system permease protein
MIPALMVMMLTMLCGFLPALNIVMEKQRGTIEQMNVTPVRRSTFILSKLIPYWVTGFVVLSVCFVVAWLVHDLVPRGSYLTIYGFSALFVLAISGLGLVISNYASSVQQAMFMMFFFVLSLIFLSGLYTPIASMPGWAQVLSIFSPLKYLIVVMRQVFLIGAGAEELSTPLVALGGFALFFNGWAIVSYKKSS